MFTNQRISFASQTRLRLRVNETKLTSQAGQKRNYDNESSRIHTNEPSRTQKRHYVCGRQSRGSRIIGLELRRDVGTVMGMQRTENSTHKRSFPGVIDSGRGTTKAEDAQGTPTHSHISPSILVYEDKTTPFVQVSTIEKPERPC